MEAVLSKLGPAFEERVFQVETNTFMFFVIRVIIRARPSFLDLLELPPKVTRMFSGLISLQYKNNNNLFALNTPKVAVEAVLLSYLGKIP